MNKLQSKAGIGRSYAGDVLYLVLFFFQAEDGIRDIGVTGVQTCALPISPRGTAARTARRRHGPAAPTPRRGTRGSPVRSPPRRTASARRRRRRVKSPAQIGRASCRERV